MSVSEASRIVNPLIKVVRCSSFSIHYEAHHARGRSYLFTLELAVECVGSSGRGTEAAVRCGAQRRYQRPLLRVQQQRRVQRSSWRLPAGRRR